MKILPIHFEVERYLRKRNLSKKFEKQKKLLELNIFHSGLHAEILEPKHLRFWSFRIDKRYRAIFIFLNKETIEIIDVNDHYR